MVDVEILISGENVQSDIGKRARDFMIRNQKIWLLAHKTDRYSLHCIL